MKRSNGGGLIAQQWKAATGLGGSIRALAVSGEDDHTLAVGLSNGVISLLGKGEWKANMTSLRSFFRPRPLMTDIRMGLILSTWKAYDTDVVGLEFHGSDALLSNAGTDLGITIWDLHKMGVLDVLKGPSSPSPTPRALES
jgi:hypothetical protein